LRISNLIADARITVFFDERMVVVGIHCAYTTRLPVARGNTRKFIGNDGGLSLLGGIGRSGQGMGNFSRDGGCLVGTKVPDVCEVGARVQRVQIRQAIGGLALASGNLVGTRVILQ